MDEAEALRVDAAGVEGEALAVALVLPGRGEVLRRLPEVPAEVELPGW